MSTLGVLWLVLGGFYSASRAWDAARYDASEHAGWLAFVTSQARFAAALALIGLVSLLLHRARLGLRYRIVTEAGEHDRSGPELTDRNRWGSTGLEVTVSISQAGEVFATNRSRNRIYNIGAGEPNEPVTAVTTAIRPGGSTKVATSSGPAWLIVRWTTANGEERSVVVTT